MTVKDQIIYECDHCGKQKEFFAVNWISVEITDEQEIGDESSYLVAKDFCSIDCLEDYIKSLH